MSQQRHFHRRHAPLPDLTEKLRRRSRKVTGARESILAVLRAQSHPISVRELFAALRDRDCDLATVYRSLHLLEEMKMVKRYDLGDAVARFELLADGDDGHHHHLICTRCAGVVEIEECSLEELEERIGLRNGFKSVTHRLEFYGVCPECQENAEDRTTQE
jgi:Fur family ferric uptake transcriptional regulator